MSNDLRLGRLLRGLRRNALFTVPSTVILSVTAGATLAMVALLDGVLFAPLAFPESGNLISLCERHERLGSWCAIAVPQTAELARRSRTIEAAGVGREWTFTLDADGEPVSVVGGLVGPGFLEALGVPPLLGRFPLATEMGEEAGRVVLLGHALWASRFGSDPNVIGRVVRVGADPHTVIGVMPEGFEVPDIPGVQLWRALHFGPSDVDRREWRGFVGVARLRDGTTLETARSELSDVYGQLREEFAEIDDSWRFDAIPLVDRVVQGVRSQLWLFAGAVLLFALIGAANVANLFLFRALRSRNDDAIRSALGAPRGQRSARTVLEGLLIGGFSAALGLGFGAILLRLLLALAPPGLPRLEGVGVGLTAVAVTIVGTLLLAVAAAGLSSLFVGPMASFENARTGVTPWSARLRSAMVSAETGLSLLLVAFAALLARSFGDYVRWDPGFETDGVAAVLLSANAAEVRDAQQAAQAWADVERHARAIPGVVEVATVSAGPLFGGVETGVYASDPGDLGPYRSMRWYDASPGYFVALGRRLLVGREFSEDDVRGGELVAVVNEALANEAWPGEDPLGQTIVLPEADMSLRVVGVVADVPALVPGSPVESEIFWSNRQLPRWGSFLVVRTAPGVTMASVQTALASLEPTVDVGTLRALDERFESALIQPRFLLFLIGVFASLAALLATGGLFAVLSVTVAERMREVGIRIALGASRGRIVALVMTQGAIVAGIGAIAGVGLHLAVQGALVSSVPGVQPAGFALLSASVLLLLLAAAAAALLPAIRASRADPLSLLRETG